MVKIRENPIKMDDLGGTSLTIFGNIHMFPPINTWICFVFGDFFTDEKNQGIFSIMHFRSLGGAVPEGIWKQWIGAIHSRVVIKRFAFRLPVLGEIKPANLW